MNLCIKEKIEQIKNGNVPGGYSHTKIGIFPDEWEVVSFDEKFNRLDRKNDEDNQNVLTISAQQGLISQQDYYNSSYASENKKAYSLLYKGDFSYNKSYSGDYLYGAIKRLDKYEKGIVSPLYICFEPKEGTNSEFYLQYFEAGLFNGEIYKIAQEGARNHGLLNVSVTDFFKMHLVNPPTEEQQKIAEILMQCDKVIELYEKEIDELQKLKKIYLKKMFPQNGANIPEFRFGKFTEPWEQRKLSECAGFRRGSFPQPYGNKEWYDGDGAMPFVQVADVTDDMKLVDDTKQKISKLAQPMSVFAEENSVLVTLQGSIGRVAIAQYGAFVDRTVLIFDRYNENIDRVFWAYIIKEKFVEEAKKAPGGTIKTITKEVLSSFDLMIPSYDEQKKIGEFLANVDNLITLHQRKLDEKKKYKKSLMQLLLTGIVRIDV